MLFSWCRKLIRLTPRGETRRSRPRLYRLGVEILEDRTVLSFAATPPAFPTGPDPHAQVTGDFAGNGRLDLAVVNEQANTVSVLMGNGDGTFQPKVDYTVGTNPDALSLGDFNGDGRPDLAVVNLTGSVSVLLNSGLGTFLPATNYALPSGIHSVAVADFNGDGHADLVVNHSLLLGNGDGTFQTAATLTTGEIVAAGDFNGDGKTDLVNAIPTGPGTESVAISLGNGDGTFQPAKSFSLDSGKPMSIAVGDFNGDGKLDVAVTNNKDETTRLGSVSLPGTISVLLGYGDGTLQPATNYAVGEGPTSVAAADVNGDGRADLVVTNSDSETVSVLVGRGDGTFQALDTYFVGTSAGAGVSATAVGDFNGDGHPDLAVAALGSAFQSSGTVSVVRNNGDGTFQAPARLALPGVTGRQQATADFNGDGIPDQAVVAGTNQVDVELGFGDGSFGDVTALTAGPGVNSLAAGDFNGDGTADLAVFTGAIDPGLATILLNAPGWDYSQYAGAVGFRVSAPAAVTAGQPFSVTVTAVDAAGNPVTGFRGEVHLDDAEPGQPLPGGSGAIYTFTAADAGSHTFTSALTLTKAGTTAVTATAPGMASASASVTVHPAAASHFGVTTPANIPAGTAFPFTVTALDVYGNVATGYAGNVHFSSGDAQAALPPDYTFTAADAGVHVFNATLFHTQVTGSVTVTDTGTSSVTGAGIVNVVPLSASTLIVTGLPNPTTAGVVEPLTITALDIYGNVATSYGGTVHFTSTDPRAVLPPDTILVRGVATVSLTLKTAGTQSVAAADVVNSTLSASDTGIQVSPAAVASFVLTGFPATTAGVAHSFTVTAYDAFGNRATNFLGMVHFGSSDAQAALPSDYQFTAADAGVHVFSAALKTAGTQALTVVELGNTLATGGQAGILVTPAAAASFTIAGYPASTAGVAHTFTVTARDAFGNVATGYTGTVAFSSSDLQAVLPSAYTFTAADQGVHTFTATLKTAGTQSLTVQDATAAIVGSEIGISVTAGAATHFALSAPATAVAGTPFSITVTALDAFGNVATGYTGKVHLSDNVGSSKLPSDYTFTALDGGVHTFTITLGATGLNIISAADAANAAIQGSFGVNVTGSAGGGGGGGGGGGSGGTGGGGGGGGGGTGGGR